MTGYPVQGTIAERLISIRQTLPASVRLIAVTKQVPVETMREAYAAGLRDFGESRIQEVEQKQKQLCDLSDICWHCIGHLQTNKANKALQLFHWIHSVDSLKLAERLNRLAESFTEKPRICLQVKLRPDPNKYGWNRAELMTDLTELDQYEHLSIQGLMTIPPQGLNAAELAQVFQQTRALASQIDELSLSRVRIRELSMGMSDDYPLAVEAGSTMVRLGRILFGDRVL